MSGLELDTAFPKVPRDIIPLLDPRIDKLRYKPIDESHRMVLRACETSFDYFCFAASGGIYPPAEFHKEWTEFFLTFKSSVILAPRNHAKSTWIMLMCAWIMIFPDRWRKHYGLAHQYLELVYITSTHPIGRKWMKKFKLELNVFLKVLRLESQCKIVESNTETIEMSNMSKIEMGSIMGSIRGIRAHFLFNDDLMKDRGQPLEVVFEVYNGSILPILYPNAHNMILGTAKADNDILFENLRNGFYAGKVYKAINIDPVTKEKYALWPSQRAMWFLLEKKAEMPPVTFGREYQNEVTNDEFSLMPLSLLQTCTDADISIGSVFHEKQSAIYLSVDLARSDTPNADYTVITAIEVTNEYDSRNIPVFIIREIWMFHASKIKPTYNVQLKKMMKEPFYKPIMRKLKEFNIKYRPQKIFIEDNQFQDTIVQMAKDPDIMGKQVLPAEGITTGNEKHTQERGIPVIRSLLMSNRLIFPYKEDSDINIIDSFFDELTRWYENPIDGKFECAAKHDDRTMSLYVGLKGILERIGSFIGGKRASILSAKRKERVSTNKAMVRHKELSEKPENKGKLIITEHLLGSGKKIRKRTRKNKY